MNLLKSLGGLVFASPVKQAQAVYSISEAAIGSKQEACLAVCAFPDHPSPPPWRSVPFLITPLLLPEAQMSLHHRPWQSLRAIQENLANIPFSGVSFSFSLLPPYLIKLLGSAEMKHRCSGIAEMIPDLGLEREGAPCEFQ